MNKNANSSVANAIVFCFENTVYIFNKKEDKKCPDF